MLTIIMVNVFSALGIVILLFIGWLTIEEVIWDYYYRQHQELFFKFIYLRDTEQATKEELNAIKQDMAYFWYKLNH